SNLPASIIPGANHFHVVALAGTALDRCRQRLQHETLGHRGRSGDPLYGIRRVLRTGTDLMTEKQYRRLRAVFDAEDKDELRKLGMSKERKVDPQMTAGSLVDRAGLPLEIQRTYQ